MKINDNHDGDDDNGNGVITMLHQREKSCIECWWLSEPKIIFLNVILLIIIRPELVLNFCSLNAVPPEK